MWCVCVCVCVQGRRCIGGKIAYKLILTHGMIQNSLVEHQSTAVHV